MDLNTYQKLAMRTTRQHKSGDDRFTNAILGLCGEVGELADAWKKVIYHSHNNYSASKYIEELGDILWYITLAADAIGSSLEYVAKVNIEKLEKRYPEGFSSEKSIMRDRDRE